MPIDYEDLQLIEMSADESQYDNDEYDAGDEDYTGHDLDDDLPHWSEDDEDSPEDPATDEGEGDDDELYDDDYDGDDDDDDLYADEQQDVIQTHQYREDDRGFRYTTDEYIEELDSAWEQSEDDYERIARGDK